MKIRNALVSATTAAALVFLAGNTAQAQDDKMEMRGDDRGWYLSGMVGLNNANDSDINGAGISAEAVFDWGPAALAGLASTLATTGAPSSKRDTAMATWTASLARRAAVTPKR